MNLPARSLRYFMTGSETANSSISIQSLSLEDTSEVQDSVVQLRIARGEKVAGTTVAEALPESCANSH